MPLVAGRDLGPLPPRRGDPANRSVEFVDADADGEAVTLLGRDGAPSLIRRRMVRVDSDISLAASSRPT